MMGRTGGGNEGLAPAFVRLCNCSGAGPGLVDGGLRRGGGEALTDALAFTSGRGYSHPAAARAEPHLVRPLHVPPLLTSPGGTTILIDPNAGIGYEKPELPPIDLVAISHDHFDHDKAEVAGAGVKAVWGVKDGQWQDIDERVGDISISNIPAYHDDREGTERGKNSMPLFDVADMRILHAGDLGHLLTADQVTQVSKVDILLLPVGGYFTIGAAEASQVVEQLQPRLVIPMHYKTDVVRFEDSDRMEAVEPFVEPFVEGNRAGRLEGNTLSVTKERLPQTTTVVVMGFR